jgi:flagellar hook-length control protein FliK
VDAIPVHVEWLVARGGGSARLRLDPPLLGPIDVSVSVRGERVEVVFTAHEAATPELVHGQREALGAALAAHDLRMEHFEVRAAQGGDAAQGRLDADLARQGGGGAAFQEPQGGAPERRQERPAGLPGGLALRPPSTARARFAAAPVERRIDLRV